MTHRVNHNIVLPHGACIRLIGSDSVQLGIMTIPEAMDIARNMHKSNTGNGIGNGILDVVEVHRFNAQASSSGDNAVASVCKLMNYESFLKEEARKARQIQKKVKATRTKVKEIVLKSKIEEHDLKR